MRVEPDFQRSAQRGDRFIGECVSLAKLPPIVLVTDTIPLGSFPVCAAFHPCCFSSVPRFLRLALHLPLRASAAHMLSAD
jgi:hypothetical protein